MKTPIEHLKAFCAFYRGENSVGWFKSNPAKRNINGDMRGFIATWNNMRKTQKIDYDDLDEMIANFLGSIRL